MLHESREPWLLKDVEKAASKRGVVIQAVKDVVQSLVDDSVVHVDNIGTSNIYWAFPGEASAALSNKLKSLECELAKTASESVDLDERLEKAAEDHPVSEERTMAEVMLSSASDANKTLKAELARFQSGDDAVLDAMKTGTPIAKEAVERWTDNVFMLKSFVEKKMGDRAGCEQFFKQTGDINFNNFDYVE
jgi:hypothetical protein